MQKWEVTFGTISQLSLFIPNEMGDIRNNIYSILTNIQYPEFLLFLIASCVLYI
jgi:hypothetical protein